MNRVNKIMRTLLTGMMLVVIPGFFGFLGYVVILGSTSGPNKQIIENPPVFLVPNDSEYIYDRLKAQPVIRLHKENDVFFCSATVISHKMALTAAHCLLNQFNRMTKDIIKVKSFPVETPMGLKTVEVEAKAVALNLRSDLALISGDFENFNLLPIKYGSLLPSLVNLANINTCGYPQGEDLVCYYAKPLGIWYDAIQMRGVLYPGMSGGPVIDGDGYVIAVNHALLGEVILAKPLISPFYSLGITVEYGK